MGAYLLWEVRYLFFCFSNRTVRGPLLLVYKACTLLVGNQAWLSFVIIAILLSYLLKRKLYSSGKYSIASTLHCRRGLQLFFQFILVLWWHRGNCTFFEAVSPLCCNKYNFEASGDPRSLILRISFSKLASKSCLVSNSHRIPQGPLWP